MSNLKLLTLLSLFFCLNTFAEEETKVFLQGNEIHYQGSLNKEANAQLFLLYKKNTTKVNVVVIKSKGGEVNTGLDLADFIFENKLNVKVLDYCLSSCANYVFPAGIQKILSNKALVAFHGGVTGMSSQIEEALKSAPEDLREVAKQQIKEYAEETTLRELKFYSKIKVNQSITTLGQTEHFEQLYGSDNYTGWYYSIEDLKKLGVKNITVNNPPWVLKQLSEKAKVFKVGVDSR